MRVCPWVTHLNTCGFIAMPLYSLIDHGLTCCTRAHALLHMHTRAHTHAHALPLSPESKQLRAHCGMAGEAPLVWYRHGALSSPAQDVSDLGRAVRWLEEDLWPRGRSTASERGRQSPSSTPPPHTTGTESALKQRPENTLQQQQQQYVQQGTLSEGEAQAVVREHEGQDEGALVCGQGQDKGEGDGDDDDGWRSPSGAFSRVRKHHGEAGPAGSAAGRVRSESPEPAGSTARRARSGSPEPPRIVLLPPRWPGSAEESAGTSAQEQVGMRPVTLHFFKGTPSHHASCCCPRGGLATQKSQQARQLRSRWGCGLPLACSWPCTFMWSTQRRIISMRGVLLGPASQAHRHCKRT